MEEEEKEETILRMEGEGEGEGKADDKGNQYHEDGRSERRNRH